MTRPLRVCLVVDSLAIGGAERHVVDLARGLSHRGHDVTIACSAAGPMERHLADCRVEVAVLGRGPVKRRPSAHYAVALKRLVGHDRFDVIHAHLYASAVAATAARTGSNSILVITEHSEHRWQNRWERLLSNVCAGQADHVIAVSPAIRARLARAGVQESRLSVVANTLSPPTCADRLAAPIRGIDRTEHNVIGVVGRLVPEKGHETLLRALALAQPRSRNVSLLVVGNGPLRERLESYTRALGLEQSVHYLGERIDARAIIAALDLLVVPSLSEGSPLVVREALAARVPVLATRVGDIAEVVVPNVNGLLVAPGSVEALARTLLDVLGASRYLKQLQPAASAGATYCDHESAVSRVEEIYRSAAVSPDWSLDSALFSSPGLSVSRHPHRDTAHQCRTVSPAAPLRGLPAIPPAPAARSRRRCKRQQG